jgi:small subunit ribosomal protein S17
MSDGTTSGEAPSGAANASESAGVSDPTSEPRKKAKTLLGVVISDKMQKTRTVTVMRLERHPRYGKYLRRRTNYKARDENDVSHEGDTVRLVESRPLSKTVRWRLVEVVEKARMPGGRAGAVAEEVAPAEGADSAGGEVTS